jgi:hypothetical protein
LLKKSRILAAALRAKLAALKERPSAASPSLADLAETPRYSRADLRPVRRRLSK